MLEDKQENRLSYLISLFLISIDSFSEAKNWQQKQEREKIEELKELLGHKPIEVLVGGLLGILSTLILYYAFQIA